MERLNFSATAIDTLEHFYSTIADRTLQWPLHILKMAVAIGGTEPNPGSRHAAMAINALQTLSVDLRTKFLETYQVSSMFHDTTNLPAWPEPLPVQDYETEIPVSLEDHKWLAKTRINHAANIIRERYITPITGQSTIYKIKAEEAQAFLAATSPVQADYPHIDAESTATGVPASDVANLYAAKDSEYRKASAALDGPRVAAIKNIEAATTAEEIATIEQQFLTAQGF